MLTSFKEVQRKTTMTKKRWEDVRVEYDKWHKENGGLFLVAAVGLIIATTFIHNDGLMFFLVVFVVLFSAKAVAIQAHREGYFDGYEIGQEEGALRMNDMTEDEKKEYLKSIGT